MRQKYIISIDCGKNLLKISEYAIIDKRLDKVMTSMLQAASYSLLGEETYDSDIIMGAVESGIASLISALRTINIYPIEPYANQIAESVAALCRMPENTPIELLFDDLELLPAQP